MNSTQIFKSIFLISRFVAFLSSSASAQVSYPPYSQQCGDDAGPPFADDGTWKYHEGSQATPVLKDNGECADKMQKACTDRGDAKTAYIEGPPDCGGKGWYCRILEQEGWSPQTLTGDLNFGYCNTTEGFEDAGYDKAGHCHGSDNDSTYYWWMRDHWHRQYNGRLRCCCDWGQLTEGKITNRCDYRRLVVDENDANNCRDANEDHGMNFNGGCTGPAQLNQPLEEDESMCWELHSFGFVDENVGGGGNGNEGENEEESGDGGENEEESGDEGDGCRQKGGLRGVLKYMVAP